MKRTILFITTLMMAFLFLSCEKGEQSGNDPKGTITVNLMNEHDVIDLGLIKIDQYGNEESLYLGLTVGNNLQPWSAGWPELSIVSVGKGNGLESIDISEAPQAGWAEEAAAEVGGLYVIKGWTSYATRYFGLRVVKELVNSSNEIIGYTLKYCSFTPGGGWD